ESAPGERRVADRMQLAGLIPAEPERCEQRLLLAEQFLGNQRADANHLVTVVGVGDDVSVLVKHVEDGEAVRGERADPAGRLGPVRLTPPLEALVAVSQRGRPHTDEPLTYRVVGALRAVRVHSNLIGGTVYKVRRGAALNPAEVEVRFVVDPPHPVRDEASA